MGRTPEKKFRQLACKSQGSLPGVLVALAVCLGVADGGSAHLLPMTLRHHLETTAPPALPALTCHQRPRSVERPRQAAGRSTTYGFFHGSLASADCRQNRTAPCPLVVSPADAARSFGCHWFPGLHPAERAGLAQLAQRPCAALLPVHHEQHLRCRDITRHTHVAHTPGAGPSMASCSVHELRVQCMSFVFSACVRVCWLHTVHLSLLWNSSGASQTGGPWHPSHPSHTCPERLGGSQSESISVAIRPH